MAIDRYSVRYNDLTFRAAYFEMQHEHPSDAWGLVGRVDTKITMKLWVFSGDPTNLDSAARKALYEHANWYRGDDRNEPQVLTLEIANNPGETSHTYTIENAWLESYAERQDPGTNRIVLEMLFRGWIANDQGSSIS